MFARLSEMPVKTKFYLSLQLAVIGWTAFCLALAAVISAPGLDFYVVEMAGVLGILGWAMRSDTYFDIRHSSARA